MTTTPAAHPAKDLLIAIAMKQQMQWLRTRRNQGWTDCTGDEALSFSLEQEWALVRIAPGQPGYVTQKVWAYSTADGERVVTARTYEGGMSDGGAMASSMKPYCVPLTCATPEGEAHAREAWQARFGGGRG